MALLGRDALIIGPIAAGPLLLETFQGEETLGRPYRYDLTLLSDDPNITVGEVLGQPLSVRITLQPGHYRYFQGIVTYFAKTGFAMHHARYRVVINPNLALFDYARDCRVINEEGQTALSIVTDCLAQRGYTDVESGSIKDHVYLKREYCLQYRETDLNFIQRLLEEEGIYYFFKHEDAKQTLVFADSATAHAKVPGYESILYVPKEHKMAREEEHFWSLSVAGSLYPGDYTVVRGYDYTKVRAQQVQFGKKSSPEKQPGEDFESYDYPGGLSEESEAKEEALVRMQTDLVENTIIEVEGNTMGLGVGDLLTLRRAAGLGTDYNPFWATADFDKEYIITSAKYSISINQHETGNTTSSDEPFKATYTLLDSQTQFRPLRTAIKPTIEGPQTAIVVGPASDEIYTDKFGRVKIQFDWDRLGNRDEESSCWVRVAQIWAGKQWGAMHIPRIGHEVIVEFLDGDPDRPIITGRVYNTDNMPPYTLPDNKTQSGIKSRSSKGGSASNFNEIRFEDLKGKEELHIQAEKDMNTLVKNSQSLSVGGDRSVTVHGRQTTTVTKEEKQTYKSSRTMEVTNIDTNIYHGGRDETVENGDTLTVQGSDKDITVHGTYSTTADTEYRVTQAGNHITLKDPDITITNGSCTIKLSAGAATLTAADSLVLTCGSSSIAMMSSGSIEVTGSTGVAIDGGGKVIATPSGVNVEGQEVGIKGTGGVSITGATVKLNG